MEIRHIFDEKHTFLPLLLLGDEQEDMIARYLGRSDLFALYDGGILRTVCAVMDEGCHTFEIKNLATSPASQRRGYGSAMVAFVALSLIHI